jgi:hypothetical protein
MCVCVCVCGIFGTWRASSSSLAQASENDPPVQTGLPEKTPGSKNESCTNHRKQKKDLIIQGSAIWYLDSVQMEALNCGSQFGSKYTECGFVKRFNHWAHCTRMNELKHDSAVWCVDLLMTSLENYRRLHFIMFFTLFCRNHLVELSKASRVFKGIFELTNIYLTEDMQF